MLKSAQLIFLSISLFAVFFTVSLIQISNFSEADALASGSGVANQKYGSATKEIVCGDKLCSNTEQTSKPLVGSDKDEQGCIGSAGYKWDEQKQQCLRPWEKSPSTDTSNITPNIPKSNMGNIDETENKAIASYFEINDPSNPNNIPSNADFLFVQVGQSGSFLKTKDGYLLTIFDVAPQVIYFADRPYRITGHMTTLDWTFGIWKDPEIDFIHNPPNALLTLFSDSKDSNEIALTLSNPKYVAEENTMQYDVVVIGDFFEELEGQEKQKDDLIPEKFGSVSLFIDGSKDCTPRPRADMRGCTFQFFDQLVGVDLSYSNFSGTGIPGNLTNTNLTGAILNNVDLNGHILTNTDLTNAKLINSNLGRSNLADAIISNTDFTNADLSSVDLSGVDMPGVILTNARLGLDFTDANMPRAVLTGNDLDRIDFSGAILSGANLRGITTRGMFTGSDLSNADFSGATFYQSDLTRAILTNTNLSNANLGGGIERPSPVTISDATLTGVNLSNVDLRGFKLTSFDLTDAILINAKLSNVDLSGAHLINADLTNAHLNNANLNGANLSGANLSGANLSGASLSDTVLTGAILTGAVLDCTDNPICNQ